MQWTDLIEEPAVCSQGNFGTLVGGFPAARASDSSANFTNEAGSALLGLVWLIRSGIGRRGKATWNFTPRSAEARRTLIQQNRNIVGKRGLQAKFQFAEGAYKWLIHPKWLVPTSTEILRK